MRVHLQVGKVGEKWVTLPNVCQGLLKAAILSETNKNMKKHFDSVHVASFLIWL